MGEVILANGFDRPTLYPGGANYLWYDLGTGCDREPYGLIPNYDQPGWRSQAQQQLAAMHSSGMRTLSIGVIFIDGDTTGTLIDAEDPAQVSQAAQNLHTLLLDIQAAGFERVLFRFFPQGSMSPPGDVNGTFDPATLDLYENMIAAMRGPLADGPLPYLIDLGVEGAPGDTYSGTCSWHRPVWQCPAHKKWSNAARDLWRWYNTTFSNPGDSIGFSFIATTSHARNRVRHMPYVYEGNYPSHLAIDLYGDAGDSHGAADQFIYLAGLVDGYSADYGFSVSSLIISETWYNDPWAAASLSSAIAATGQPVSYLTEWPLERGGTCASTGVNVLPPYEFDIYHWYGF